MRTTYFLTDPTGQTHKTDDDGFHEKVAELQQRFGVNAELEGFAVIDTGPQPLSEIMPSILAGMETRRRGKK